MMIEKAGQGIQGTVTDASTGQPIAARVDVQGKMPIYNSPSVGDYHEFLRAGTYNVTITANGYDSQAFSNVVVVDPVPTILNAQLGHNSANRFAYKVLTTKNFLDNQVPADPGITWNVPGMPDGLYYALGDAGYAVLDMGAPRRTRPGTTSRSPGAPPPRATDSNCSARRPPTARGLRWGPAAPRVPSTWGALRLPATSASWTTEADPAGSRVLVSGSTPLPRSRLRRPSKRQRHCSQASAPTRTRLQDFSASPPSAPRGGARPFPSSRRLVDCLSRKPHRSPPRIAGPWISQPSPRGRTSCGFRRTV